MKTIRPHTPIQYIIGKTEFLGLEIEVDESVLIPRPETELLAEEAISVARFMIASRGEVRILDLCAGSGNIAISLTKYVTNCKIVASDISADALRVAKKNALSNGVCDKIEFVRSDLFSGINGKFDIIVSNPPYIAGCEFEGLQKEVLMEPRIALYGGEDGMDYYRRIFSASHLFLERDGQVMVEIGYGQKPGISDIINNSGYFNCSKVVKDSNGIDRVMVVSWIN